MDNIVEQVVKQKKNAKYYIKIVVCLLIDALIPATFIILAYAIPQAYLIYIGLFSIPFLIYGTWYFITSLKVDFEYDLNGSIFEAAKIIANRKRKKIVKLDVKEINDLFKYSDEEMSKHKFMKVYHIAVKEYCDDNYVISFHSEIKGRCAIVFSPNEQLLEAMKPYFNAELKKKLYLRK